MALVLGVDIGGSHVTAALIDLETRTIVDGSLKRKTVDATASAEKILAEWCDVMLETYKTTKGAPEKIGIAMPGPFDYEEGICLIKDQDKFKALYKMHIKENLAARLKISADSIRFINDAASFLQGEVFCGAVKDVDHVLGLTLGSGLGSARCIGGRAHDADLWKSPFKEGIAEDYLSTRWFLKRYQELTGKSIAGVKELIQEGAARYIEQIFSEFSQNLALFLIPYIKTYQSKAVVFGGNISNAHALFFPALNDILIQNNIQIEITTSQLNEEASLIGAASCWRESVQEVMKEQRVVEAVYK